jgi:hypothetical protein
VPLAAYAVRAADGTMHIDALLAVDGAVRRAALSAPVDGIDAADRLGSAAAARLR